MSFGDQSVTFVTVTGTGVFNDYGEEVVTTTETVVAGCRHRPLSAAEATEAFGNVATQIWKSSCPPVAAAIAAKASGTLKEGGRTFHVLAGAQPFTDMAGDPFKVTILSEIVV